MTQEIWVIRLGFILATVGNMVSLENIWQFPWQTIEDGGSVLLVVYLDIVPFTGIPGLLDESVIDYRAKKLPTGMLRDLSGSKR